MAKTVRSTVEDNEIAHFSHHAGAWWEKDGALRSLHQLNPLRIAYIRDKMTGHFSMRGKGRQVLKGLSLLDVGCGGGLASEPMARLGAEVTGIDASAEAIAEARRHADMFDLSIDYRVGTLEELAKQKKSYDVVTALEIVEHVADLDMFMAALAKVVKPGGMLILSTVNRTPQSFLLGIVAAEYILRWVPRGTHHWSKFRKPSELVSRVEAHGLQTIDLSGIIFDPVKRDFHISDKHLAVNYMMTAVKREN
jgi:2-polyprenyl-6-hydroxyphenyl methylase/3-demethylubiquinone-9 3-methyltransferase